MSAIRLPQCAVCARFNAENRTAETCSAFPKGIPANILDNSVDHRKPVDGDNGQQWVPLQSTMTHPLERGTK